jgi:predicted kinase
LHAIITVGIPASGKSTFAESQAGALNINLDDCRAQISGDASNQNVTQQALALRDQLLQQAMEEGQLIIVSDTNLIPEHRSALIQKFKAALYGVTLLVFDTPFEVCVERNRARDRQVPDHAMQRMQQALESYPPAACAQAHGIKILYASGLG